MKFLSSRASGFLLFLMAGTLAASAGERAVLVKSVNVNLDNGEPVVEILSSSPVIPNIQKLEGPSRLVIELPNSKLALKDKRPAFSDQRVRSVRVEQFQNKPPLARVVLDLKNASNYSWDAAGNRLLVRLHPQPALAPNPEPAAPPTVTGFNRGEAPMAIPISTGNRGELILADSGIEPGSLITAGDETAILSVRHGGELRVCPRTTVSVTNSSSGQALMLGMSNGALEANYNLQASSDSVLTPDFRIVMNGPGNFHFAVSTDARGTTCVRALPGNSATAIVSELIGDGTYQVKPTEQVVFHNGRLDAPDSNLPADCGCPASSIPVRRTAQPTGEVIAQAQSPGKLNLSRQESSLGIPRSETSPAISTQPAAASAPVKPEESTTLPELKPNEVRVQVEAPFVFRGDVSPELKSATNPRVTDLPAPAQTKVEPAPARAVPPEPIPQDSPKERKAHRGFFGKVKGFFSSVFH